MLALGACVVLGAVALALGLLTAVGSHARGQNPGLALVTGLFFPVTWTVWYFRDERPYGRPSARH